MEPYLADPDVTLYHGDCREVLRSLPDASIDAVVTDPPYELGFMGKRWDASGIAYSLDVWGEVLRVLKPGGHLLAFGGTRTYHRMTCAIEDAGFEIRDCLQWIYGSGFPKSLDVSKAIDKAAGVNRKSRYVPNHRNAVFGKGLGGGNTTTSEPGVSAAARQWDGWGTALKPANEPIVLARKPLSGTVAANVLAHGVGALNIDACRIGTSGGGNTCRGGDVCKCSGNAIYGTTKHPERTDDDIGRWPANVLLDDAAATILDIQSGTLTSGANPTRRGADTTRTTFGEYAGQQTCEPARGSDTGGASRFFYVAKPAAAERNNTHDVNNLHPTVKPVTLMRHLARLITPPGGLILDPFIGSGTTALAARAEGFQTIGIDQSDEYLAIAAARLSQLSLLG